MRGTGLQTPNLPASYRGRRSEDAAKALGLEEVGEDREYRNDATPDQESQDRLGHGFKDDAGDRLGSPAPLLESWRE